MKLPKPLRPRPGSRIRLSAIHPGHTGDLRDKEAAAEHLRRNIERLTKLQHRLYADNRYALLIVLQGMDAAGKDGTIRHVMSGVNPQGCTVTSFKTPTPEELDHDFLWRIHRAIPRHGEIGIFNRSHYEDVLIARVHRLVPRGVWKERYELINDFERMLTESGVVILKFFLHISPGEQKKRLEERLKDPARNWKFSPADLKERRLWPEYMKAYEDVLTRCNTRWAPWFVIPSDHKWFRNLAVSQAIVEALQKLDLRFPKPAFDVSKIRIP